MSEQINYITLKITLTETSISVSTIKDKKEEFIELIPGIQTYPINIRFNKNEILVSQKEITQKFQNPILNFIFSKTKR